MTALGRRREEKAEIWKVVMRDNEWQYIVRDVGGDEFYLRFSIGECVSIIWWRERPVTGCSDFRARPRSGITRRNCGKACDGDTVLPHNVSSIQTYRTRDDFAKPAHVSRT